MCTKSGEVECENERPKEAGAADPDHGEENSHLTKWNITNCSFEKHLQVNKQNKFTYCRLTKWNITNCSFEKHQQANKNNFT